MSRPRMLMAHPWMGRGGSEATAMWAMDALQDTFDLTFTTASTIDWKELNDFYGTSISDEKVRFVRAPKLPMVDGPSRLVRLQAGYFERFVRKLARDADVCVSAYNPIVFGKPAIQLIGDFSFSEEMRKRLYIYGDDQFCHRETIVRKLYLSVSEWLAGNHGALHERGDLVLANSEWSAGQLSEHFQIENAPVIYPPVVLPSAPADAERDPLGFVCLGRVVPEKEIERIISILEMVRERGYPVTLRFIGNLDESAYASRIGQLIAEREWIVAEGFLGLEEKQAILASQTFAIHACRIEAFGIAVAEMASMGCIPIVPATGGAREIVPFDQLHFDENEEACEKIVALLEQPESHEDLRTNLSERVAQFGPKQFKRDLRQYVDDFMNSSSVGKHEPVRKQAPLVAILRKIRHRVGDPVFYQKRFRDLWRKVRPAESVSSVESVEKAIGSVDKAVVFVAHPDDEVFCSGLIIELVKGGSEVSVVCLTRGEGGPTGGLSREELGAAREKEMRASCEALGVSRVDFLGHVDPEAGDFRVYAPSVSPEELSEQLRPYFEEADFVLTHGSSGEYWHPAHLLAHKATAIARGDRRWGTFLANRSDHHIPTLLNRDDPAHLRINLERHSEQREIALRQHQSQLALFRQFAEGDISDFIEKTSIETYSIRGREND